jgi:anaerobic magnesium-protoporphyrin IX monomethyl ester cyclase
MGSFIIGVPGETRLDVLQTINFAKTCGVDFAQFTVMTPYPGTEVYEMAKREGLLVETDWSKYTTIRPVMKTNELTPQEISKLIHMAYKSFYIRGNFFLQQIKHKRINWLEPIIKHYFLKMKFS